MLYMARNQLYTLYLDHITAGASLELSCKQLQVCQPSNSHPIV